jgi:hypothetical protein
MQPGVVAPPMDNLPASRKNMRGLIKHRILSSVSNGGMGVTRSETSACPAYLASLALAFSNTPNLDLPGLPAPEHWPQVLGAPLGIVAALAHVRESVTQADAALVPEVEALLRAPRDDCKGLQRRLAKPMENRLTVEMRDMAVSRASAEIQRQQEDDLGPSLTTTDVERTTTPQWHSLTVLAHR